MSFCKTCPAPHECAAQSECIGPHNFRSMPTQIELSAKMIEEVFREWEAEHPGLEAKPPNLSSKEFADRVMAKVSATARELPEGNA